MSLGRARLVEKRALASVLGYCQSCCLAIPNGRFHLTSLYSDLNSVEGWARDTMVKLHGKSLNELRFFWLCPPAHEVGRSWFPPTRVFNLFANLVTDASKYAWGAHLLTNQTR